MITGSTAGASRPDRLCLRRDFELVFGSRARSRGPLMTLHGRINGRERSRFGISIGKKVGIAVERNRIKRRLREVGRAHLIEGESVDLVIRPSRGCLLAPFDELGQAFARQLTELRSKLHASGGAR